MKSYHKMLLCTITITTLALTLCSCTEQEGEAPGTIVEYPVMSEIADEVLDEYEFPAMFELTVDSGLIDNELGVTSENFSDVCAYVTEEPYGIERIFVGVVREEAYKEESVAELTDYFNTIKAQTENYTPEEYKKAKDAEVYSDGNFICLIICNDSKSALDTVKEIIK